MSERFWLKVWKTETCWLWTLACDQKGYGRSFYKGRLMRAHRLAWILTVGDIPDGLFVCHHCDVPTCVNPDHLFLGTAADNSADMSQKGRFKVPGFRGEDAPSSILTTAQVIEAYESNESGVRTARRLGVSPSAISLIRKGKNWGHVTRDLSLSVGISR